jgi:translation initiation factor 3 subunit H
LCSSPKCPNLTPPLPLLRLVRAEFTDRDIFEEVPVRLHNSTLVTALLTDWAFASSSSPLSSSDSRFVCDFDRLDLSTNPFLEKNLECLIDCVDDLTAEQSKYEWQKRKRLQSAQRRTRLGETADKDDAAAAAAAAAADKEPSRLDQLLIANQMASYCEQIHAFAGLGVEKLFAMEAMHKSR